MNFFSSRPGAGPAESSGSSGQVTVFLSIILMAMILLAAVLVDISRINAGRSLAKKAVDSAARSVLAEYGGRLNSEYGLFALSGKDDSMLAGEMEKYISRSLTIPLEEGEYGKRLDLYGFRVEEINVTSLYNLGENDVFRRGILEYMKYRAPKKLVEGFLDRLSIFGKAGKMSAAYKKKVGIDKLLGRMDKSQQRLKKKVDGDGTAGSIFVNGFNSGGAWTAAFSRLTSLCSSLDSLKKSLSSLDAQIAQLQPSPDDPEGGLATLLEQRSSLAGSIAQTRASIESSWRKIRYGLTGDYKKPNSEASDEVGRIVETGKKAETALSELEAYISENFKDEDSLSKDFVQTTNEEIKRLRDLVLSGRKAEEILTGLADNKNVLGELEGKLDQIKNVIDGGAGLSLISKLAPDIGDLTGKYKFIDYSYEKPQKGESAADPRMGKKEDTARTLMEKLLSDRNYLDEGIKQLDLPSFTKMKSRNFLEEDAPYLGDNSGSSSVNAGSNREAVYPGDLSSVGESVDLYDEEGSFQEDSLGFIGDIGSIASGDIAKLRDNVYFNEYIMGTYRNSVPAIVKDSEIIDDKDFQGRIKSERETFYEAEVEYILHGNPSEKANKLMTRGQILLVRFGLNTLHVYTDAKKRQLATGIATVAAGWWTGGAGIPILSNLIMCGWGMGESILDLKELLDGKSVPVYKLQGDWKLDIGLEKGGTKTDTRLYFSYYDYLRLFLLGLNEEKKLDRMEDLIQINMGRNREGFRMSDCKTFIRVEAVVSMKYLFLNRGFVPPSMRTPDGRHKFSIMVYEGY